MSLETALLDAVAETPGDPTPWLVLADWLEDQGDPRAELFRLTQALRLEPGHALFAARQARVQELLAAGVAPLMPRWTDPVVGVEFVLLPPGSFWIGSPPDEPNHYVKEVRRHITFTRPLYFATYPVTQAQWQAVRGDDPSAFPGPDNPVEQVSWDACQEFCRRYGQRIGRPVRLPTSAEWEYACRAGTTTPFAFGASASSHQANFNGRLPYNGGVEGPDRRRTTPVDSFRPNPWGLYDLHGNVWEWVQDWYGDYPDTPGVDPTGPEAGSDRMLRGGCWSNPGYGCRSASRNYCVPATESDAFGCRVCFTPA